MIKVNLVCVGKVKEKYFQSAIDEYAKRLSRFCDLKIFEVKEENFVTVPSESEKIKIIEREGEEIFKKLKGHVFVTCIEGEFFSSENLAKKVSSLVNLGEELTFVIGGSYGISQKIKGLANTKISFSKMTFPHTLFRVMCLEQVYRAFMINANSEYHK